MESSAGRGAVVEMALTAVKTDGATDGRALITLRPKRRRVAIRLMIVVLSPSGLRLDRMAGVVLRLTPLRNSAKTSCSVAEREMFRSAK